MVEKWLERIPFLTLEDFDFIEKYEKAVNEMLEKEIAEIKSADLTDQDKKLRIRMIDENRKYFERVLNENQHKKLLKRRDEAFL